jgi:hypothetical protein
VRRPRSLVVALVVAAAACGGGGDGDGDPAAFCDRLDRLTRNDPFLAFGDTATPGEIEQGFAALADRADELVDVAPPEARGATRDLADAVDDMASLMDAAGFDGEALDARAYRDAQVTYAEASDRLLRYLDAEC